MPRLLRRRLQCFYCNQYSRNDQPGIPRSWYCSHCEAMNHLDQRGRITDPPAPTPQPPKQYARDVRERSPTPVSSPDPIFCDTCQRNQSLINQIVAEYIPDEDDPEYEYRSNNAEAYKAQIESQYPIVCDKCVGRVQDTIRAGVYTARTDNLRRVLEESKKHRASLYTPRQIWTLRIIRLAKWAYFFSLLVGIVWHSLGILAIYSSNGHEELPFWSLCISQIWTTRSTNSTCFEAWTFLQLVKWAIIADGLTFWWNPKLEQIRTRTGGRMRGLLSQWTTRSLVLGLRIASYFYWQNIPHDDDDLSTFRMKHGVMLAFILISIIISWNTVRIEYPGIEAFAQPIDPYLPTASQRQNTETEKGYEAVGPKRSAFDTMGQSFTSSFSKLGENTQPPDFPPSPTLTATSISRDSDIGTPWQLNKPQQNSDAMDWTPTQRRFGKQPIEIQPSPWIEQSAPPQPPQPHSIFAKPDPNPFNSKVPAFPKNPIRQKQDPWRPGLWAPVAEERKSTFLADIMKTGENAESRARLQQEGVPKNVQNNAAFFKKPQFKYDYTGYTNPKTTGLEDSFNDLFST